MLDPWPDEPDEPDTETRWGNPERDLPKIPEVSTDETDVDPHTFKTFWVSVVFANVALFGMSLGLMLWYFRGQALFGGGLFVAGVLAALRTYASYRTFKAESGENPSGATDDDAQASASDDGGATKRGETTDGDGDATAHHAPPPERNG